MCCNNSFMLVICKECKYYSLNMASDNFEHHESGGLPWQPIDFYRERIGDMGANDVDVLCALETLVAKDLIISEDAAAALLTRKDFPGLIRQLRDTQYDPDEKGRIITEVFSMAPLLNIWPSIRELRSPEEAAIWLRGAVDLALSEDGGHEACTTEELVKVDCLQSPFCPKKTVAKALAHQAMQPPSELELMLGGVSHSLDIVRSQLELGVEEGLITREKAGALTEAFFRSRQPS
jgi:hypothetical protein